jgi:hypothetical protein
VARAVVRARAVLEAAEALDGSLPGQPLRTILGAGGAVLSLGAPWTHSVAFRGPQGSFVADLGVDEGRDAAVAERLGRALVGRAAPGGGLRPLSVSAATPTHARVAIDLLDQPLATACHLHRRVWSKAGGPWLGLGDAPPFEVLTTCHVAIDGYGHALLASEVFRREDALQRTSGDRLYRAACAGLDGDHTSAPSGGGPWVAPEEAGGLGLATRDVDALPRFPAAAYALGRTLEALYRRHWSTRARRRATLSPTFHVPVAPDGPAGESRRRQRVVPGLCALRMDDGAFEPFDVFSARVRLLVEREVRGRGALTRMAMATLGAPFPAAVRKRLLVGGAPSRLIPVVEALSGRGCLSLLRFAGADEPAMRLYAASYPALADVRAGATVMTLIDAAAGGTVTVSGTGLTGQPDGAERFLDAWLGNLPEPTRS